jgi:glycosyltransferase involved in cell wall biosynthesis
MCGFQSAQMRNLPTVLFVIRISDLIRISRFEFRIWLRLMRITFIIPQADLSGGIRIICGYARQLHQRGHDVLVVSRPPRRATVREKVRSAWTGQPLPNEARRGPTHFDDGQVPHRVIDEHRPIRASDVPDADVVVATWWETAHWVAAFPPSKGAQVYFIQGYEVSDYLPARTLDETWRLPMHKIVIARWLAKLAEERFGDTDYSLVPNAVDLDAFSVPPRGKNALPTVGMVYTHVTAKGCDLGIRAVETARQTIPQLQFVCFGSRQPTDDLALPIGSQFSLHPPHQKIREIYSSADAWLFCSRQEGFGLPLLEALACRTPVVATRAGAAPDVLAQGGGVLVETTPDALACGMLSVLQLDEPAWKAMSDNALAAASRYTWDRSTALFEAALRRAIEKSNA